MESNIKGLVAAGHEMASELKAECGAVDMRSVAKLISDLATQLEVQLVRANALAASGDVWLSGCGVFPSEQAYRVWRKTPEKAADPTLIRKLPDGEIRRYDRRLNIICRECRKSEAMQRVLAFYQGNFEEVVR